MYAGYLPVSGPLDFRLVIQVLLSPRMFLNACVRRLHPCLTSLAEDVALPLDRVIRPYPSCTMPRPGIEPGLVDEDPEINHYTTEPPLPFTCVLFVQARGLGPGSVGQSAAAGGAVLPLLLPAVLMARVHARSNTQCYRMQVYLSSVCLSVCLCCNGTCL